MSGPFDPRTPEDVVRLIAEYPLAWVVSRDFQATPLPLLAETDDEGIVISLLGHFARRNPQVEAFERDARALILFHGPHGYISPTSVSNPTWGPTWNYAVARFEADLEFVGHENDAALNLLAAHLEKESGWSIADMGPRYEELARHIVAFRAHVRSTRATFKLGQDEKPDTFAEIVDGLGGNVLAQWMMSQHDQD